jgi:hypothetical protein
MSYAKKSLPWVLALVLAMTLSGCADVVDWHSRTVFGIDCRPDHRQATGECGRVR